MTDVFFPDRSQFQGRTISHELAVCARASEGNWLTDPDYAWNVAEARAIGARAFAYHFLEDGSSAASQAAWCHAIVGPAPLMLDVEPIVGLGAAQAPAADGQGHFCGQAWRDLTTWAAGAGHTAEAVAAATAYVSRPSILLAEQFIDAYRALGGVIHDLYLPHWYWQVLGSPDLAGMRDRHMFLTSSAYVTYGDSGPGWAAYGGMTPQVWQYTDTGPWSMDWNAFKGSPASVTIAEVVTELWNLLTTGDRNPGPPPPPPARQLVNVQSKAGQTLHTLVRSYSGNRAGPALARSIQKWPAQWDTPALIAYLNAGNWDAVLPVGTWFALWQ